MTRRKVLTELQIQNLKPHADKRLAVPDAEVPGLYIRVTPNGKKTFTVVARRPDGKQLWREVGAVGVLKLAEARDLARDGIKAIKRGTVGVGSHKAPNLYRLTFLPTFEPDADPTDECRNISTPEEAHMIAATARAAAYPAVKNSKRRPRKPGALHPRKPWAAEPPPKTVGTI